MTTPTKKTAKQISDVFIAAFEAQLSQSIPLFPKSFNRIIAKTLGLVFVVLFQVSEFVALQLFVKTASDKPITIGGMQFTPLDILGEQIGLTRGTGQRTAGSVTITVLDETGAIPAGTRILDADSNQIYITISETALDAPTVSADIRSINYAAAATLEVGETLSFVSAPAAVEKEVVVATVTAQGADPETTSAWRTRQLEWWAARPQGGAYADYRLWGGEVEGVENIYPFSGGTDYPDETGPGFVDVYVEASETEDGIPGTILLDAVYDAIEKEQSTGLANRRPINTVVNVEKIRRIAVNVVVSGLNVDLGVLESTKDDIETALEEYFLSRENYIDGLTLLPKRDAISETEAGGIVGRVAAANGGTVSSVTFPDTETVFGLSEGQKAKLGTLSWS